MFCIQGMKVIDKLLNNFKLSKFILSSCSKYAKALRYFIEINTKRMLVYEKGTFLMYYISKLRRVLKRFPH
jgi:hypothetical protein